MMAGLPTWQAAGLSLAVIVGDVFKGAGALAFALLSVGVIWTLHRLHTNATAPRSTADLIASVPGAVPASAIRVIQFSAYAVMGAYAAAIVTGMALVWFNDPKDWWGPALSVTAVAVAAALVAALPTRLLAPVATVLAAFSLLVFFYLALAVIARVASGTAPIAPSMGLGSVPAPTDWGPAALLVALAIALAGFEIPTTVSDRLRSVGRPLGCAMAVTTLCAATALVAANMGTTGEFRYDAGDLVEIATEMFGETANPWFLAATMSQAVAALLVLMWGTTRAIRPAPGDHSFRPLMTAAAVTGALVLALSTGWADAGSKLWGVGALLLLVVYAAAAHANSRLDDANTTAWAWFAVMGIVLVAVVFLTGLDGGWWPIGIAAVIVGAAAAWAVKFDRSVGEAEQLDDTVIAPGGVAPVDGNRLPADE